MSDSAKLSYSIFFNGCANYKKIQKYLYLNGYIRQNLQLPNIINNIKSSLINNFYYRHFVFILYKYSSYLIHSSTICIQGLVNKDLFKEIRRKIITRPLH